tara:strand:+ start:2867 stop:3409 length:543 start_codon:yes stop_codon:yes gene_type:complete
LNQAGLEAMLKYIQAFDLYTFNSVFNYSKQSSLTIKPTSIARIVSRSADGWLYLLLIPMIFIFRPGQIASYFYWAVLGFSLERSIYYVLKNTIKRPRPCQRILGVKAIILASDEFSLPSGHTSAAFFFCTFLCLAFSLAFLPLYLWACAVGLSRVVLGVHYLTDIFIGAAIGFSIALLIL